MLSSRSIISIGVSDRGGKPPRGVVLSVGPASPWPRPMALISALISLTSPACTQLISARRKVSTAANRVGGAQLPSNGNGIASSSSIRCIACEATHTLVEAHEGEEHSVRCSQNGGR